MAGHDKTAPARNAARRAARGVVTYIPTAAAAAALSRLAARHGSKTAAINHALVETDARADQPAGKLAGSDNAN